MKATYYKIVIFFVLASLIQSCGFRLRGSSDLPSTIEFAAVVGVAEFSEVGLVIKQHLTSSGAQVISTPDDSSVQFVVVRNVFARRVLSVDSTGRASEYEISYEFSLRVVDAKGKTLVIERTVSVSRSYIYDVNNALAISNEEEIIKSQLIVLAVSQAMRRIAVKLRNLETDTNNASNSVSKVSNKSDTASEAK